MPPARFELALSSPSDCCLCRWARAARVVAVGVEPTLARVWASGLSRWATRPRWWRGRESNSHASGYGPAALPLSYPAAPIRRVELRCPDRQSGAFTVRPYRHESPRPGSNRRRHHGKVTCCHCTTRTRVPAQGFKPRSPRPRRGVLSLDDAGSAATQGLEPQSPDSESGVLPLDEAAMDYPVIKHPACRARESNSASPKARALQAHMSPRTHGVPLAGVEPAALGFVIRCSVL